MTRDDIIRVAKEAGFTQIDVCPAGPNVWIDDGYYIEVLERFAALVAAAEREACALLCEETRFPDSYTAIRCAAAIRARGEQEQPR